MGRTDSQPAPAAPAAFSHTAAHSSERGARERAKVRALRWQVLLDGPEGTLCPERSHKPRATGLEANLCSGGLDWTHRTIRVHGEGNGVSCNVRTRTPPGSRPSAREDGRNGTLEMRYVGRKRQIGAQPAALAQAGLVTCGRNHPTHGALDSLGPMRRRTRSTS